MKRFVALIAVAGAALFAAAPTHASSAGSGQGGGTIPIVFQLTVHGQVPQGESFYLFTDPGGEVPAGFFCSTKPGAVGPTCRDGGTYTVKIPVPAGEPLTFSYVLSPAGGPLQTIESHSKVFTPGEVVSTSYSFSGADPSSDPPASAPSSAASTSAAADQYSSATPVSSASSPAVDVLPNTGGTIPVALLGGGFLIVGGILMRRLFG
ncbi:hypothetical protein [Rubrobacter calidifluminis]|uniref:hypothetical protein n=1 Tax=Rubrobacter calidifluminis TaxID=1392640 RepID=UPI00235EA022|nr:hypothetical protein [Rubrobacter calidifluminis]